MSKGRKRRENGLLCFFYEKFMGGKLQFLPKRAKVTTLGRKGRIAYE